MKVLTKLQLPNGTVIDAEDLKPEEKLAYIEFALHLSVPLIAKLLVNQTAKNDPVKESIATNDYDKWYFDLPPTLTVREVAKILRVGVTAVYDMCRIYQGDFFPHIKMGKRIIIPRDNFIEWMNAGGRDYYKEQVELKDKELAKKDAKNRGFQIKA